MNKTIDSNKVLINGKTYKIYGVKKQYIIYKNTKHILSSLERLNDIVKNGGDVNNSYRVYNISE